MAAAKAINSAPSWHAVEVSPAKSPDAGGAGQVHLPEKIKKKPLTSGNDDGTIESVTYQSAYKKFASGKDVHKYFGGSDVILKKRKSAEKQWLSSLTKDEKNAISNYCGDGYYNINAYLRQITGAEHLGTPQIKEYIDSLDTAISKFDLKDNITVYRGVDYDALSDIDLNDAVGAKIEDKGYMSTSPVHVDISDRKDCLLEIQVPSGKGLGAYVNSLSGFKNVEYEFLLKRGTRCEILSVDTSGEKPIIKMRVIV